MNDHRKKHEIKGPVLALDLGKKRIGAALSDELLISIRRLKPLSHTNWKQLLKDVAALTDGYDARTLVIGLPLRMDGTVGEAAQYAQRTAEKFAKSLSLPVYLQDERLTSIDATERLRAEGLDAQLISTLLDSESAAIILRDFLASEHRVPVESA